MARRASKHYRRPVLRRTRHRSKLTQLQTPEALRNPQSKRRKMETCSKADQTLPPPGKDRPTQGRQPPNEHRPQTPLLPEADVPRHSKEKNVRQRPRASSRSTDPSRKPVHAQSTTNKPLGKLLVFYVGGIAPECSAEDLKQFCEASARSLIVGWCLPVGPALNRPSSKLRNFSKAWQTNSKQSPGQEICTGATAHSTYSNRPTVGGVTLDFGALRNQSLLFHPSPPPSPAVCVLH